MRASLSFWVSTSSTAAEYPLAVTSHRLEVIGWDRASRRVYVVEHVDGTPTLFVIATTGEHAGAMLPLSGDEMRIARLRGELAPLLASSTRGWELTTRVVQRRGLRLASSQTPVRKFALGLSVAHKVGGVVASSGRTTVTAYLRPRAVVERIWQVPNENLAVAVVTYCGVPAGVGFDRQVAILATPALH
jgi:hypothetical protein